MEEIKNGMDSIPKELIDRYPKSEDFKEMNKKIDLEAAKLFVRIINKDPDLEFIHIEYDKLKDDETQ